MTLTTSMSLIRAWVPAGRAAARSGAGFLRGAAILIHGNAHRASKSIVYRVRTTGVSVSYWRRVMWVVRVVPGGELARWGRPGLIPVVMVQCRLAYFDHALTCMFRPGLKRSGRRPPGRDRARQHGCANRHPIRNINSRIHVAAPGHQKPHQALAPPPQHEHQRGRLARPHFPLRHPLQDQLRLSGIGSWPAA